MTDGDLHHLFARASLQGPADICLIRMPFPSLEYPSIALGILKSSLADQPVRCQVIYADLLFAEWIGIDSYRMLSIGDRFDSLGEWVFAGAAFPDFAPDNRFHLQRFATHFCRGFGGGATDACIAGIVAELEAIRCAATAFTQALAGFIVAKQPRLVGCSSTFEQQVASLALLREIKRLAPEVITILGGSNCEAEMGLATVREFPWVDYVFSGDADLAFPAFCAELTATNQPPPAERLPYGMITRALAETIAAQRAQGVATAIPRAVLDDLDRAPMPDYSDYFRLIRELPAAAEVTTGMLMETSRGCWWGEKHPCTFCGLNGCGASYRAKSPDRVLAEFAEVTAKHQKWNFGLTDSVLNMRFFDSVLPALAAAGAPYRIFCEVKSNLTRAQVRMLCEAGIKWCQPGIEGLHDAMLKLMNKGASALANVQFLKYTSEFGIHPIWSLLVGFPGEDDAWHLETAAWLPLIYHLQPGQGIKPIRYDRFSTYQKNPAQYGLTIAPFDCYEKIYPSAPAVIADLAYYFRDAESHRGFRPDEMERPGVQALLQRHHEWAVGFYGQPLKPILAMTDHGDRIEILDTRPCAPERRCVLDGALAAVYRACESVIPRQRLSARLATQAALTLPDDAIDRLLGVLKEKKLVLDLHGRLLALAVAGALPDTEPRQCFPIGDSPLPRIARILARQP